MDRRVIFVAEPAPLIGRRRAVSRGKEDGCGTFFFRISSSISSSHSSCTKQVALDLEHLRGAVDELSAFCRAQRQPKEESIGGSAAAGGDDGTGFRQETTTSTHLSRHRPTSLLPAGSHQETSAAAGAAREDGRDSSISCAGSGYDGSADTGRVLLAAVFACPALLLVEKGPEEVSASQAGSPLRRDIADLHQHHHHHQQQLEGERRHEEKHDSHCVTIASALADALESCGVWLSPEDFEVRVLAPSRALIDLQLEYLLRVDDHINEDAAAASTAASAPAVAARRAALEAASGEAVREPVCWEGGVVGSSYVRGSGDGGGGNESPDKRPRSPSSFESCDRGATPALGVERTRVTSAMAEDFVRISAEEISLLSRQAAAEMARASSGPRAGRGQRLGMLDVLWVAASTPENESERSEACARTVCADAGAGAVSIAAPSGPPLPSPPPLLTLSTAVDRPRSSPLRMALRNIRTCCPRSRITIWPGGIHAPELGKSGGGGDAAVVTKFHQQAALKKKEEGVRLPSAAAPENGDDDDGRRPRHPRHQWHRRLWGAWCDSTGARLMPSLVSAPATGSWPAFDGGLLWRGALAAGALSASTTATAVSPPHRTSLTTTATTTTNGSTAHSSASSSSIWSNDLLKTNASQSVPGSSTVSAGFPALDGFALRVMTVPCGESSPPLAVASAATEGIAGVDRERELRAKGRYPPNDHCGDSGGGGGSGGGCLAVPRAAACVLGLATALRLARVISPVELARSCHLLADEDIAPALELFVEDEDRFPGSAAFLKGWAADGRGMILVAEAEGEAAAESAEKTVDGDQAGGAKIPVSAGGLAMACFPQRHSRPARVSSSEALSWKGSGDEDEVEAGGGATETRWSVTLFRRPLEFSEAAVSALVGDLGEGCGGSIGGVGVGLSATSGHVSQGFSFCSSLHPCSPLVSGSPSRCQDVRGPGELSQEGQETKKTTGEIVSSLPVYTSASLFSVAHSMFNATRSTRQGAQGQTTSHSETGTTSESSSPVKTPVDGAATIAFRGRKRRRSSVAAATGGVAPGAGPRGSKRRAALSGDKSVAGELSVVSSSPSRQGINLRRSGRTVNILAAPGPATATTAGAAAAATVGARTKTEHKDRDQSEGSTGRRLSRTAQGGCQGGKRASDGDSAGAEERQGRAEQEGLAEVKRAEQSDTTMSLEGAAATAAAAAAAAAAAEEEVALNAVMDAWAARLPAGGLKRGSDRIIGTAAAVGRGEKEKRHGGGGGEGLSSSVAGNICGDRSIPPSSTLAHALYASVVEWDDTGSDSALRVPGNARRRFWAEEVLLPGVSPPCSRMASLDGSANLTALAATAATTGVVTGPSAGGDGGCGEGASQRLGGGCGDEVVEATTAPPGLGNGGKSVEDNRYGNKASGAVAASTTTATEPYPPQPPKRTLSTAEEVLEKARQQQRARVKERRAVAREQRARMDRPRPRSGRPASGSGGSGGGSGGGGGSSGYGIVTGNAAFRRGRGSSGGGASHAPPTLGAVGRTNSMGSKLSRGSRLLGRSMAESNAAATVVAAAGDSRPGGSRGTAADTAGRRRGGDGSGSSQRGARLGGGDESASAGDSGLGSTASRQRQRREQRHDDRGGAQPITSRSSSLLSSSSSPSSPMERQMMASNQPKSVVTGTVVGAGAEPQAQGLKTIPAAAATSRAVDCGHAATQARRAIFRDSPARRAVASPAGAKSNAEGEAQGPKKFGGLKGPKPATAAALGRTACGGANEAETRLGEVDQVMCGGGDSATSTGVGSTSAVDTGGLGNAGSMIRKAMERAMLAAVAAQMGLPEDDPAVREVLARESRHMGGGGGTG